MLNISHRRLLVIFVLCCFTILFADGLQRSALGQAGHFIFDGPDPFGGKSKQVKDQQNKVLDHKTNDVLVTNKEKTPEEMRENAKKQTHEGTVPDTPSKQGFPSVEADVKRLADEMGWSIQKTRSVLRAAEADDDLGVVYPIKNEEQEMESVSSDGQAKSFEEQVVADQKILDSEVETAKQKLLNNNEQELYEIEQSVKARGAVCSVLYCVGIVMFMVSAIMFFVTRGGTAQDLKIGRTASIVFAVAGFMCLVYGPIHLISGPKYLTYQNMLKKRYSLIQNYRDAAKKATLGSTVFVEDTTIINEQSQIYDKIVRLRKDGNQIAKRYWTLAFILIIVGTIAIIAWWSNLIYVLSAKYERLHFIGIGATSIIIVFLSVLWICSGYHYRINDYNSLQDPAQRPQVVQTHKKPYQRKTEVDRIAEENGWSRQKTESVYRTMRDAEDFGVAYPTKEDLDWVHYGP